MDNFKNVPNTLSGIEQEIGALLTLQQKGPLTTEEATKLEKFKTDPMFANEYENVIKDMDFGSLPEDTRVELVRKDIDKNILGEAA
jgi:hypothetical protein